MEREELLVVLVKHPVSRKKRPKLDDVASSVAVIRHTKLLDGYVRSPLKRCQSSVRDRKRRAPIRIVESIDGWSESRPTQAASPFHSAVAVHWGLPILGVDFR